MRLVVKVLRSGRWEPVGTVRNATGPIHAIQTVMRAGRVRADEAVAVEQQARDDARLEVFEATKLAAGAA